MRRNHSLILATLLTFFASASAFADLDPELAGASAKNEGGLFIGGGLKFGQTYATGKSNPGLGYLVTVEPGWVATRGSWGRLEASLLLGNGMFQYTKKGEPKSKVTIGVPAMLLARLGYGWSLGSSMFGLARVGAGPVMANFTSKTDGVTAKSDGTISGLAGQIGFDLVSPMSDFLAIVGGFDLTHIATEVDEVKSGGVTYDVEDTPINLNVFMVNIGVRLTF